MPPDDNFDEQQFFGDLGDPNSPERALNDAWEITYATRDGLSIGSHKRISYETAVAIAGDIAPKYVNPQIGLMTALPQNLGIKATLAKAYAELQAIAPLTYVQRQTAQLEELLQRNPDAPEIVGELEEWKIAQNQLMDDQKKAEIVAPKIKITESQAINYDQGRNNLPLLDRGYGYHDYDLTNQRILRIQCLHPDPAEWSLGCDMLYEYHDQSTKRVRLVALQYKLWDGKYLYTRKDDVKRASNQIERLRSAFCTSGLCTDASKQGFGFPCGAYLHPVDKLQRQDQLRSSGEHLPVCLVNKFETVTKVGAHSLSLKNFQNSSIPTETFDTLFFREMLGSRWLTDDELDKLYVEHGLFNPDNTIKLRFQEFSTRKTA